MAIMRHSSTSPKEQRRPLPSLLSDSSSSMDAGKFSVEVRFLIFFAHQIELKESSFILYLRPGCGGRDWPAENGKRQVNIYQLIFYLRTILRKCL